MNIQCNCKKCDMVLQGSCKSCCWCLDQRTQQDIDTIYLDGEGYVNATEYGIKVPKTLFYCPKCKKTRLTSADVYAKLTDAMNQKRKKEAATTAMSSSEKFAARKQERLDNALQGYNFRIGGMIWNVAAAPKKKELSGLRQAMKRVKKIQQLANKPH